MVFVGWDYVFCGMVVVVDRNNCDGVPMAEYVADFRQGDTVKIKLTYPAGTDLTGYSYFFTMKSEFSDPDDEAALVMMSTAGDYADDDVENGVVYIVIPSDESDAIESGKYFYELRELTPLSEVRTVIPPVEKYKDKIFVAPQVNQSVS